MDQKEALRALDDIQGAKEKSSALRGYAAGGIYMIVWGIVWIAGGASSLLSPEIGRWGWTVSVLAGVVASIAIGFRSPAAGGKGVMGKVMLTMMTMAAVSIAISFVLNIGDLREATALQTILVAGAYMAFGVWRGARIFVLGVALGAAVLIAWFFLADRFEMVVGIAGGVMLILSGILLRRA
ncbi:MAG: hypothetical protein NT015_05895 [Alphaproteobacteria bacterium]|nr:hypothetical protein [Alphaproteobacteria bacterium]